MYIYASQVLPSHYVRHDASMSKPSASASAKRGAKRKGLCLRIPLAVRVDVASLNALQSYARMHSLSQGEAIDHACKLLPLHDIRS
jgi:hypothetical protein